MTCWKIGSWNFNPESCQHRPHHQHVGLFDCQLYFNRLFCRSKPSHKDPLTLLSSCVCHRQLESNPGSFQHRPHRQCVALPDCQLHFNRLFCRSKGPDVHCGTFPCFPSHICPISLKRPYRLTNVRRKIDKKPHGPAHSPLHLRLPSAAGVEPWLLPTLPASSTHGPA